jgi:hypothetical protein
VYSTYLGGTSGEVGEGIAVDGSRNAYVTGATFSTDFPTTAGAYDRTFSSYYDAFVTKLKPDGSGLVYSTYLGGLDDDFTRGIAADGSGYVYVTGLTSSTDFPTTAGAYNRTYGGNDDAFVTKLNPTGSSLLFSTYLGGSDEDRGDGIAMDGSGNAYVTGATSSTDFPTTAGATDSSYNNNRDAFVAKFSLAGSEIGVFRNSTHMFYLDYNGNGAWNGAVTDRSYNFGLTGDNPVAGDWNFDGKTEIGVFRNSTHLFYLDYNGNGAWNGAVTDRSYNFGLTGDIPATGDWNNNGKTEICVFRNSTHLFYLDYNGNGAWNGAVTDRSYNFGLSGDLPATGDWNNDGKTEIGVFRSSTHTFYLDYNGNGAWNGAVKDRSYNFGITGDTPVAGAWG